MLMLAMIFFGYLSFRMMGVGQMPDVDFPVLTVDVTWEGAAPEVMETDVADIIEDACMGIEGLRDISSSSRQGSTLITLEFDLNRDIDVALQEVQSKLSEAQRRLPRDIDPPVITKANPEDQPIMWMAVTTTRPLKDLMDYVDRNIKDRFKTISGVGEVFLGGFVERNLRVWIDIEKLKAYDLTVSDVIDAISREHVEIPAGRLETSDTEINVRAMGEALSVEEFQNISISTRGGQPNYKPILLSQVARIEDGLDDIRRISRFSGQPAVGLGVRKQRGANSVAVAKEVKKRLKEVQKELPSDFKIELNFDSTKFIEDSVHELVFTLILSALLTSLVCWLFLGSWSSTLNILLAIPTSVLGSFVILKFANFTLNTFTLLALSLAIGVVVDDAIMVLENIVRHRELGESQTDAAIKGAKEISFAALAATIAIIAIFLPVAFMKGIMGKFFFQFGVTISVAVALSLIEALTFAPMRCSQFLDVNPRVGWIGKQMDRFMNSASEFYKRTLAVALKHRKIVLIGSTIFFFASLGVIPFLRKEFVPAQDQSMFLVRLQTPIGSSIEYTSERFKEAEKIIMAHPAVKRCYVAVGGFGGGEVNSGMSFITLKSPQERPRSAALHRRYTQEDVMNEFRVAFKKIPGINKVILQDLSMRGFAAQRGFPIEFSVRGPNWDKLIEYSRQIQDKMKQSDLFNDVDTDYLEGMPEVRVYPDRDKAFDHAVSVQTLAKTINALIGGERVGKYTSNGKRYDVRVKAIDIQRTKLEDIKHLQVWNNRGELVELQEVIKAEQKPSLLTITRRGRERAVSIFANVGEGKSQATSIEKVREIAKGILPESYHIVFSGTSQTFKESFQSLMFALWLGILISYMVLASQFNHVVHPFTVLLALPFSITGAFFALLLANQSLNIFSLIGLILLLGLTKKNSILIVEFTNQLRERGLNAKDALTEACPIRFRPILMTSVSTIAAAIPPALAIGPGAETRIPMAVAVVGGMTLSTLLTFYVVPCAYLVFTRFEKKHTSGMSPIAEKQPLAV
jgi:HAE1 family hydrophobic/amphiphilic exporter-1